jgi:hypothetical protein
MRPVLPIHLLDVDETQVRLVHECCRLEAVTEALPSHTALGDAVQFPLDQRDQG